MRTRAGDKSARLHSPILEELICTSSRCPRATATGSASARLGKRDQIVAEQKLEQLVKGKAAVSASCNAAIEKRLTAWKTRRDANCKKSASREWGGGSMLPTAVAMCKTAETERMSKAIEASDADERGRSVDSGKRCPARRTRKKDLRPSP
ncbi:lysozyme inhibitor LprI family protein [Paraburkholderia sp. MM5384-R2]|uniref:lysozyme inhibitor LprI family protein n=1 Tax=Paraburkholderia sp. MM5384-R2 TaxID=2723097 RepID=UPI0021A5E26A|nr:lysozyme inhibitor LprI family protein [Paraburkholderia sp. MM5384-R2]